MPRLLRVKLGAGCDSDNSECDLVLRDTVRNFGDSYGVEGAGNRENPGSTGDESFPDAIGIARSIPSFVVVSYEDGASRRKKNGSRSEAPSRG